MQGWGVNNTPWVNAVVSHEGPQATRTVQQGRHCHDTTDALQALGTVDLEFGWSKGQKYEEKDNINNKINE